MDRPRTGAGKTRSLCRTDPIVKEKSYALDLQIANDEAVRAIFAGRSLFSGVVLSIPGRRERVAPDIEFVDIRFAKKNTDQFSFRVVNAQADRPIQRRRHETDPNASRCRGRGRPRRFLRAGVASKARRDENESNRLFHPEQYGRQSISGKMLSRHSQFARKPSSIFPPTNSSCSRLNRSRCSVTRFVA